MRCKRDGVLVNDRDCFVCGWCEREYTKKVASFQTIMPVDCPICKRIWDHVDGGGIIGVTSRTCPSCVPVMKERMGL